MTQQYSLRWNNHQPNFISMFTTLLNTQTLVDVTLAAEGKQLQAHKVVLSACSTYFQALFVENPSRHPIVILKDVTFANLRTMVDFMYYGEVNVTEDQLPQVLDTAKLLKIKGLTEMPESTLLTRSQGASADFTSVDHNDQKPASPASPPIRRKRRRKSSTGSTSLNMVSEERHEEAQTLEVVRDGITVNSVTSRRLEFDERQHDTQQNETHLSMGDVVAGPVEHSTPIPPESLISSLKLRRSKFFKRQNRVEDRDVRRQVSAPTGDVTPPPALRKHDSYPQYAAKNRSKPQKSEKEMSSVLIRAVPVIDRQSSGEASVSARASHTPAVRSGPPLSCNFCWNTIDECGRILRRKTQYHCPECRTNLCIVPCFHQYHEAEVDTARTVAANAR